MKITESILAFEAVGTGISVCYHQPDQGIVFKKIVEGFDGKHQLPPLLHQCIKDFGKPDALATAIGPGSFTGLRVCSVAARSIGWLDELPVYAINSLEALSINAGHGCWLTLMNLKKDTTFYGLYTVNESGVDVHCDVTAQLDEKAPCLPSEISQAQIIGPALITKPDLPQTWGLDLPIHNQQELNAEMLIAATGFCTSHQWDTILPKYYQLSAPELQRAQKTKI